MKYLLTAVMAISLFAAACEDPAANKTKATVNEPSATTAANTSYSANAGPAVPVAAKGDAHAINGENSKVDFTGSKVTGKHDGGFNTFTGTIDLVNRKPAESSVTVDIDAASVYSDDEKLTGHLKSADFFDVEKFPKASFRSTKIEADPAKGADAYTITGDFNLHGMTKSISFPATIKAGTESVDVDAEFAVNRKDFGIVYAGKADDLIRDDVVIKLTLKAPRKK
ncbi:MAG: YceI family protein [bacterium]|nr:YceI family protein [bacterium]